MAAENPSASVPAVANLGDRWRLSSFPELVVTDFDSGDAAPSTTAISSKGIEIPPASVVGSKSGLQLTKSANGVEFPAGTGQRLLFAPSSDAVSSYRWIALAFQVDGASGASDRVTFINVNNRDIAGGAIPKIYFEKRSKIVIVFNGADEEGSRAPVKLTVEGVIDDGKSWNCLLVYRRNGRLFARLNGTKEVQSSKDVLMLSAPRSSIRMMGEIGDASPGVPGWTLGRLVFGQSEISELTALKLEASILWELRSQKNLPTSHAYSMAHPLIEQDDFPYRYKYDAGRWSAWGSQVRWTTPERNVAQRAGVISSFERVFYDDFVTDTVGSSTAISGQNKNWFGPGWNTSVGGDAALLMPADRVDVYEHSSVNADPASQSRGMINLSLKYSGGWKCGAIYSVNNMGQGRAWGGAKAFRARIKYPRLDSVPGGIFPAFWSYGLEALFWRTSERIEVDFFEVDCRDDNYLNGGSSHVHKGQYPGYFGHLGADAPRVKVFGGRMTEGLTGVPGGLHFWDGNWHTWEFLIDDTTTYFNVTIDKGDGEEWVELFRCPTPPEYKEKLYIILNQGLRKNLGEPDKTRQYDMFISSVEVLQRKDDLDKYPEIFRKKPEISGDTVTGATLSCEVELTYPVTDISYYWYADGHPRGFGPDRSYRLGDDDFGRTIRCMVKVAGAVNQPEAWTNSTNPVVRA